MDQPSPASDNSLGTNSLAPLGKVEIKGSVALEQDLPKLSTQRFVFLDTETTGLDPKTAKVIELAMAEWSLAEAQSGRTGPAYEQLFNPGESIPPVTSAVHHIVDEMVQDAPNLASQIPTITQFVNHSPILAYNAPYDRSMLPFLDKHVWLDIQRLVMNTWHIGQLNPNGFPLTSFKQQELRYWLGFAHISGNAHRADADVEVSSLIWGRAVQQLLDSGFPDDYSLFLDYFSAPIQHHTLPFGPHKGKCPSELTERQLEEILQHKGYFYQPYRAFDVFDLVRATLDSRLVSSNHGSHHPQPAPSSPSLGPAPAC